jgi:hypothetical protein
MSERSITHFLILVKGFIMLLSTLYFITVLVLFSLVAGALIVWWVFE